MRILLCFTGLCLLGSCGSEPVEEVSIPLPDSIVNKSDYQVDTSSIETITSNQYTAETFETPGIGWGYKIFDNGKPFINQPHIPAISGTKGFSTEEKARITGEFAISKMEQGFIPPTLSPQELDSLGVLD